MTIEEIIEYAELIDPAIVRELNHSKNLADNNFFTEASLRIGRAVEASLYSIAREIGVNLNNLKIAKLSNITDSVRKAEVDIIRKGSNDEIRSLANISKLLSETIAHLTENGDLRKGQLDSLPRPNEQLLRELLQIIDDDEKRRRLSIGPAFLRKIQEYRNDAAHASLDGSEREIDKENYEILLKETNDFLTLLFDFILGERAKASMVFEVAT